MFDLMNEMSELIYVSDLDTHELLFLNDAGKKTLGIMSFGGQKCYQVLQGKDCPCEFCTNRLLSYDEFYTWEHTNPLTGRHYLLKDKLTSWSGKEARLEIAFDMTEKELQKIELSNALEAENTILNCVEILQTRADFTLALDEMLENLGRSLQADRTYLFRIEGDRMSNTHEWCAEGVGAEIDHLQNLPVSYIDRWRPSFDQNRCVVITDLNALKDVSPIEYDTLGPQGITCMVTAPIYLEDRLVGYLGADNPPKGKIENISAPLITLSSFISSGLQRQADRQWLEKLSYTDMLTGVYNRNAYNRDLEHLDTGRQTSIGVVSIDVNGMKNLNDKHGHPYGDRVLAATARSIQSLFPQGNLYRVGGDEFVLLCHGMICGEFDMAVQKLNNRAAEELECRLSIGSCWSPSASSLRKTVYDANEEMYKDKRKYYRGQALSNRYRHDYDDVLGFTKPGAISSMLSQGLFRIQIQPKFSVSDCAPIGGEALIRYRSPEGETIPPDDFIPLLESARLIHFIDFYVFEQVCRSIARWLEEGRCVLPISVNFSRYTLTGEAFYSDLLRIWENYRIPKHLVEIEVTETVQADDEEMFNEMVSEIRAAGFAVSIDDFGSRYANLSLFTNADFDVLKIDRSLVIPLAENERARAVIQSISDICRKTSVHLIVEGVETGEQLDILREIGCEGMQGYLLSRPLPQEEFEARYIPAGELLKT